MYKQQSVGPSGAAAHMPHTAFTNSEHPAAPLQAPKQAPLPAALHNAYPENHQRHGQPNVYDSTEPSAAAVPRMSSANARSFAASQSARGSQVSGTDSTPSNVNLQTGGSLGAAVPRHVTGLTSQDRPQQGLQSSTDSCGPRSAVAQNVKRSSDDGLLVAIQDTKAPALFAGAWSLTGEIKVQEDRVLAFAHGRGSQWQYSVTCEPNQRFCIYECVRVVIFLTTLILTLTAHLTC